MVRIYERSCVNLGKREEFNKYKQKLYSKLIYPTNT